MQKPTPFTNPLVIISYVAEEYNMKLVNRTNLFFATRTVFAILVVVDLLFNLGVMALLVRGRRHFKQHLFYVLAFHILLANAFGAFSHVLRAFPGYYWDLIYDYATWGSYSQKYAEQSKIFYFGTFLSQFSSQMIPFGTLIIAVHRFSIFVTPSNEFFQRRHIIIILLFLLWIVVFLIATLLTHLNCGFIQVGPALQLVCMKLISNQLEKFSVDNLAKAIIIQQLCFPLIELSLYLLISLHLFIKRGRDNVHNAHYYLMLPAALIFLTCELSSLSSAILFFFELSQDLIQPAIKIVLSIDQLAGTMMPIIIFTTNSDVRKQFSYLFRRQKNERRKLVKSVNVAVTSIVT